MYRKLLFLDGEFAGHEVYQDHATGELFDIAEGHPLAPTKASVAVMQAEVIPVWARATVTPGAPTGIAAAMGIAVRKAKPVGGGVHVPAKPASRPAAKRAPRGRR